LNAVITAETHFTDSGASPPALTVGAERASRNAAVSEPLYLTAEQVADLLQIDPKTVSRWSLEDPSMPVLRRGRVVRFPRERLMVWLERQEPRTARRSAHGQRKAAEPAR
jgi:excisionase family DNA binding protein